MSQRISECESQLELLGGSWDDMVKRMRDFYGGDYDKLRYGVEDNPTLHQSQIQPCIDRGCGKSLSGFRKSVINRDTG